MSAQNKLLKGDYFEQNIDVYPAQGVSFEKFIKEAKKLAAELDVIVCFKWNGQQMHVTETTPCEGILKNIFGNVQDYKSQQKKKPFKSLHEYLIPEHKDINLKVEIEPGVHFEKAFKDAHALSKKLDLNVEYEFNGKKVIVCPHGELNATLRRWSND